MGKMAPAQNTHTPPTLPEYVGTKKNLPQMTKKNPQMAQNVLKKQNVPLKQKYPSETKMSSVPPSKFKKVSYE